MTLVAQESEVSIEDASFDSEFELSAIPKKETRILRISSIKPFGYFGNSPQIPIKPVLGTCPQMSWRTYQYPDGTTKRLYVHDSEDTD
jgi:hypothetical protein